MSWGLLGGWSDSQAGEEGKEMNEGENETKEKVSKEKSNKKKTEIVTSREVIEAISII